MLNTFAMHIQLFCCSGELSGFADAEVQSRISESQERLRCRAAREDDTDSGGAGSLSADRQAKGRIAATALK